MAEIIPLTKAIMEHHKRRLHFEGKTSDNLDLSTIRVVQRPWRPGDDDDPEDVA